MVAFIWPGFHTEVNLSIHSSLFQYLLIYTCYIYACLMVCRAIFPPQCRVLWFNQCLSEQEGYLRTCYAEVKTVCSNTLSEIVMHKQMSVFLGRNCREKKMKWDKCGNWKDKALTFQFKWQSATWVVALATLLLVVSRPCVLQRIRVVAALFGEKTVSLNYGFNN